MDYNIELDTGKQLTLLLFRNVKNTRDLRKKILSGTLKCCVIKPRFIVDPFQIAVAANKAVLSNSLNKMATKSLYTEILFNLSLSKNITQSLMKFGVGDTDSDILVCVIDGSKEEVEQVLSHLQGEKCPLEQLHFLTEESSVKKEYKITEAESEVSSLLESVVSRIAAKELVS